MSRQCAIHGSDGTGNPVLLAGHQEVVTSAAFSPDGTRIVTASQSKLDPATGKTRYWAAVWSSFEPLTSPDDPESS